MGHKTLVRFVGSALVSCWYSPQTIRLVFHKKPLQRFAKRAQHPPDRPSLLPPSPLRPLRLLFCTGSELFTFFLLLPPLTMRLTAICVLLVAVTVALAGQQQQAVAPESIASRALSDTGEHFRLFFFALGRSPLTPPPALCGRQSRPHLRKWPQQASSLSRPSRDVVGCCCRCRFCSRFHIRSRPPGRVPQLISWAGGTVPWQWVRCAVLGCPRSSVHRVRIAPERRW